jgi:DNA (cytosine-5)-methyltransferase 1
MLSSSSSGEKTMKNKKPTLISLFSGAGGMDLGFIRSGYEIIWAIDNFKEAVDTYQKNIGFHILNADITQIDLNDIPDNPDVIIGGFPCQGFSIANTKRSMKDSRNYLYLEMLRIIKSKRPKFFVAENVKGLLSMEKGKIIDLIVNDFKDLGYEVDYKLLNAAEFGVPQIRERVFIIGNNIKKPNIFPQVSHYLEGVTNKELKDKLPNATTTNEAIGFLSNVRTSFNQLQVNDRFIFNHIAAENVSDKFWGRKYLVNQADVCDYLKYWRNKSGLSTKKIDEHFGYKHTAGHWFRKDNNSGSIPKPEDWWELKKLLGFDDKFDKQVTTLIEKEIKFEQSLRITNWDRPSDTITATSPEIHVNKLRRLSARECAIIQTFPDDFIFSGSLNRIYKQIGNAVPVLLAEKIANTIKELIST